MPRPRLLIRAVKDLSAGPAELSHERAAGREKRMTKLVVGSGQLLLDGEFNPPPSPPETQTGF